MATKRPKSAAAKVPSVQDICFTIMPFGGWLDDYYVSIYSPAIRAAGMEPHRADDLFRPSTIVKDIWAYTRKARLLLADLTGKNPNVFYELGLAHALAKPVILVAESMDDIPFDLRALRIIVYDKNVPDWGAVLRGKIETSIKEVLAAPVDAVLPAFLEIKAGPKPSVTPHEKEIIEIKQELDLLRRQVRSQPALFDPEMRERMLTGPTEAEAMIRSNLRRHMPADVIFERLVRLGVPSDWAAARVHDLSAELQALGDPGVAAQPARPARKHAAGTTARTPARTKAMPNKGMQPPARKARRG